MNSRKLIFLHFTHLHYYHCDDYFVSLYFSCYKIGYKIFGQLGVKITTSQASEPYSEPLLVVSSLTKFYTISFACILSKDNFYWLHIGLLYTFSFSTVHRVYSSSTFYCSFIYSLFILYAFRYFIESSKVRKKLKYNSLRKLKLNALFFKCNWHLYIYIYICIYIYIYLYIERER